MPIDFNELFSQLKEEVAKTAKDSVKEYADSAKEDGLDFLENSKAKLKRWTDYLASGVFTIDEFKSLVDSQKDLFQMELLKQKGISKTKLNNTKNKIIDVIVKVAVANISK